MANRIGKLARKARVSLGLTQEDAAERLGVTVEFYARIERGSAQPSLRTLIRMAVAFELSTDYLIGLSDEEEAPRVVQRYLAREPDDPPELKRLIRRLRQGNPGFVELVAILVRSIQRWSVYELLTDLEDAGLASRSKKRVRTSALKRQPKT
ncbi:MAG: helix-turn-helix domain-containing protein, partial [Myxococcota bacterium]